jgi:hypothetical protein
VNDSSEHDTVFSCRLLSSSGQLGKFSFNFHSSKKTEDDTRRQKVTSIAKSARERN